METDVLIEETVQVAEAIESVDLMTVLAVVIMVYVAFNLFYMLEKFRIKD